MFTGLIQDRGRVVSVAPAAGGLRLGLSTRLAGRLTIGDSLAVNGVCLTLEAAPAGEVVSVVAVAETQACTTIGSLRVGQALNLEPALRAGEPLGGHWVQGHVDGVGQLREARDRQGSLELRFASPPELRRFVVHKGSIAVDGVSLTVAALDDEGFGVALVPHTLQATTLGDLRVGDRVNLETDILGKYIDRLLGPWRGATSSTGRVTEEWLREHGFGR